MADTISKILIKSSLVTDTPSSSDLERAELAYSYSSNRLFIGHPDGNQSPLVIGGTKFLELFETILDDDGTINSGQVLPNRVIVAGEDRNLDYLDIGVLKVAGRELATRFIDKVTTSNAFSDVSHTQLATAQATKEYVDQRTERFLLNFDEESIQEAQILIADANNRFENRTITGDVILSSDGFTKIRDGIIKNEMLKNASILVGTQEVKLGGRIIINMNEDTSGILRVHRGGIGRSHLEKHQVVLGNELEAVQTSSNFIFDTIENKLYINESAEITRHLSIGESLEVADSFFATADSIRFQDYFKVDHTDKSVNINADDLFVDADIDLKSNLIVAHTNTFDLFAKSTNLYGDSLYISANTVTVSKAHTTFDGEVIVNGQSTINGDTIKNGEYKIPFTV